MRLCFSCGRKSDFARRSVAEIGTGCGYSEKGLGIEEELATKRHKIHKGTFCVFCAFLWLILLHQLGNQVGSSLRRDFRRSFALFVLHIELGSAAGEVLNNFVVPSQRRKMLGAIMLVIDFVIVGPCIEDHSYYSYGV